MTTGPATPSRDEIVSTLTAQQEVFLGFLERKVGDRALAQDLFQEALLKALHSPTPVRDLTAASAWFYRVLRTTVIDHARKRAVMARKLEAFAEELATREPQMETLSEVCRCVSRIAQTLKPEYREAMQRIEVDGTSVKDFALEAGITSGNAAVRVHRAREALRTQLEQSCGACAERGCIDCTCSAPS